MLPVMDNGEATILSVADATQYAPEVPWSLIQATLNFFVFLTALTISSDATAVPPGELISNKIALILTSLSAFSISSITSVEDRACVNQPIWPSLVMAPLIGIKAVLDPKLISELKNKETIPAMIKLKIPRNTITIITKIHFASIENFNNLIIFKPYG